MNKFMNTLTACAMAVVMTVASAIPAFAATNSVASQSSDIAIVADSGYNVAGKDTDQNKKSEYQTVSDFVESTDGKTYSTDVYATIAEGEDVYDPTNPEADPSTGMVDGTILVSVPKTLILGQTGTGVWSGAYTVKVKGNITGKTIINVVPDASFKMSQEGKNDITVSTNQPKTKFVVATSTISGADVVKGVTPTFNDNATTTGTMSTNEASAGSWHGVCNFAISMTTAQ